MNKLYIIISLIGISIIGFLRLRTLLSDIQERIIFIWEYRDKFIQVANSDTSGARTFSAYNIDYNLYHWLTLNSVKAQRYMGNFGIGEFVAPFQLYKIRNYEFIVGTVSKFTEGLLTTQEISMVDNILTRRIGHHKEIEKQLIKEIANPIKWFQYGVRLITSIPVYLLNWFGIISENSLDAITSNTLFKFISGIIALISFLSALITIFTGWSSFIAIIISHFK
jgi:hypothetical protein